jgi:molecular chaperone DnaK
MVDYSNIPRDSRRVPLETRVQFKFDRFSGFLSDFSANISPGGMFIRTRAPQPPGTVLEFEFRLGDGFELIKGRGEVVWLRPEDEGPTRPMGMGLRFLELSLGSKELIYRIVDHHIQQGGTPFDVTQRPPDPIPVPAPAAVAVPPPRPTPLPPPAPQAPSPATTPSPLRFDLNPTPKEPAADAMGWLPSLDDDPGGFDPSPYVPARDDWMKSREPLPDEPFPELAAAVPLPLPELEPEPMPAMSATSAPYGMTATTPTTPTTAMTEPAAPPETPFFGATLAAEPARRPRRTLPWILLAVLVVVAAGAFLFRDALLGLAGLGGDDEIAQAPSPASRRRAARPAPTPASDPTASAATPAESTPTPTPDQTPAPTPAPTPSGLETEVSPVRPAPTPATQPEKPAPVPAIPDTVDSGPAATAVEKITFEPAFGGTDIILWGNGALRSRSYTRSRIDGNPPRELIRITGIKYPFPSPRVVVGTPEVLQVRTGIHGSELHIVLDLAGPKVTVTRVEEGENRLRIHLQRQ